MGNAINTLTTNFNGTFVPGVPPKVQVLAETLFVGVTAGGGVGGVSDDFPVAATPPNEAFAIWGIIYTLLLLVALLPPFSEVAYNDSLRLNGEWIKRFAERDLSGALETIRELRDVNNDLADAYAADFPFRLDPVLFAYDAHATWVTYAEVLNDWVVRLYGATGTGGTEGTDGSSEALAATIQSYRDQPDLRPGQRFITEFIASI